MKNIQETSRNEWIGFARRHQRYALVAAIFAVFVFYAAVVVPDEPPKKSKSSSGQSAARMEWDISTDKPEKAFPGVLQGREGDWYRLGVSTVANRAARIDASLSSVFDEDAPIGALAIAASDDFQYHEILFRVPAGTFSDIRFVLRDEAAPESWSYTGVRLSEFALSRLNVYSQAQADRLAPTLAGNIEHMTRMLPAERDGSGSGVIFASRFTAEADFVENIRLHAREKSRNNGYVLELREAAEDGADTGMSVKKVILAPGEIDAEKDEWGNQSILLPARLERGKKYLVTLTGTGDASRDLVLSPLEGLPGVDSKSGNIAAIVFGRYAYAGGGAILSGARVEDFGGEILYSYALSGEVNDFFDLFDTEGSVKFDTKEDMIAGRQQQRTSFTYRFFTVYPFERFMLAARQAGDKEKEVKLEYSFDNAFWREVPATQANNEPQIFSLALTGIGDQRVVYVRASYNGEDKKTGSFGLDQLSVRAELIRK